MQEKHETLKNNPRPKSKQLESDSNKSGLRCWQTHTLKLDPATSNSLSVCVG